MIKKENLKEGKECLSSIQIQLALDLVPPSSWHCSYSQGLIYQIKLKGEGRTGLGDAVMM